MSLFRIGLKIYTNTVCIGINEGIEAKTKELAMEKIKRIALEYSKNGIWFKNTLYPFHKIEKIKIVDAEEINSVDNG